jgi:hypothetical protein
MQQRSLQSSAIASELMKAMPLSGTGITVCTPMLDAKGGLIESCPTFLGCATSEMSRMIMPAPPYGR